jgi:hypothetical protein
VWLGAGCGRPPSSEAVASVPDALCTLSGVLCLTHLVTDVVSLLLLARDLEGGPGSILGACVPFFLYRCSLHF